MHKDPFAVGLVGSDFQRVFPRGEGLVGWDGFYPVVGHGVVAGEHKVVRVELERLAVESERFAEDLLFIYFVKFHCVLAKEENRRGEILVINRLPGVQLDGFGVIFKGLFHRTAVAIVVRQIVPRGGIFRVQFAGLFPMFHPALFVVGLVEETAVGQVSAGVFRVPSQEILVSLADGFKPMLDASAQRGAGQTRALFAESCFVADPFVHFLLRGVVLLQKFLILLFHRVVRIRGIHQSARRLRDEIA